MILNLLAPGVGMGGGQAVAPVPTLPVLLWSVTPPALLWSASIPTLQWSGSASTIPGAALTWSVPVAVQENFAIFRGADVAQPFTQVSGGTYSISGKTLALYVYTQAGGFDSTPVLDSTITTSVTFTIADANNFTLNIPRAVTLTLPRGLYWYEVREIDSGTNEELAWGQLVVGPRP